VRASEHAGSCLTRGAGRGNNACGGGMPSTKSMKTPGARQMQLQSIPSALAGPFGHRSRQTVHAASSARPLAINGAIPWKNTPHVHAAPTSMEAAAWMGAAPATARPMPAHSQVPAAMRGCGTARALGARPVPCISSRLSRRNRWRGPFRRARCRRPTAFLSATSRPARGGVPSKSAPRHSCR
jgi:hypothetical protein